MMVVKSFHTCEWIWPLMSYVSAVALIAEAFPLEAFELVFTTGPHFVLWCFCLESPWHPAAKVWSQDKKRKKITSAPCVCSWFDKSSALTDREDTEVVATAPGHLSGFAQRNLKHLNLFDHKEAMIYSMLAWHLFSHKLPLIHSHPEEDGMESKL